MKEYKAVEQALDALKDSFALPLNKLQLKRQCNHTLTAFQVSEQMKSYYIGMFLESNYQAANADFFQKVKVQLDRWKQIFEKERLLSKCLDKIQIAQFDLKQSDIVRLRGIFEQPYLNKKNMLIERFFLHLSEMFLLVGDNYMKKYDMSGNWRANYEMVVSSLSDILMVCYRKYCKYYHLLLQHSIKSMFDNSHIRTVEQIEADVTANLPRSINDSATTSLLHREPTTSVTMHFVTSILKHDSQALTNQFESINSMSKKYRTQKVKFTFLSKNQEKGLCFILSTVFKQLEYSEKQKQELKKLLTVENLGLDIWSHTDYLNINGVSFSKVKSQEIIVCLFLSLTRYKYTGIIRHYLQYVLRHLSDFQYHYSNFQILIMLENKNMAYNETLDLMRKSEFVVDKEIKQIMKQLKVEDSIKGDIPKLLTFQKIGQHFKQSRVITIFISGFTCQDAANAQSWRHLLHNGQTYAMNWQCLKKSIVNIFKLSSVIPTARNTGVYLAHIIRKVFKNYLVNLVGFSLGTEVISFCLDQLKGDVSCINKVVLLSGVAHVPKLEQLLAENTVEVINCFTESDLALRAGLALFERKFRPCGLNQIGAPNTRNINTTSISNWYGHRVTHIELRKFVEFDTDVLYQNHESKHD